MPSTVRVATDLIRKGEMQAAWEKLEAWLKTKPGAAGQPDFIMFCRTNEAYRLQVWRSHQRKEAPQ